MRYGVPYKGSKNAIAPWVCSFFPRKTHFYDLFAGGCAVTHCALLENKFKTYTINDITKTPQLFCNAIKGKYKNENRWISRNDFYRLKDTDEYVRLCWSFGNNGDNYLFSKEVEPWKKALHFARVFNDTSLLQEFGIKSPGTRSDITKHIDEYKAKYIKWYCKTVLNADVSALILQKNLAEKIADNSEKLRNYLLEGLQKAGKRLLAYEEIYGLQDLMQRLERLESLESLERLESLESLESLERSYCDVEILPDSVIYCDIPYKDTDAYDAANPFDHEAFYEWCEKQTEPVFISEYDMPRDRFTCIGEKEKAVLLCSGASKTTIERIFIPKHQKYDPWHDTLFEGLM